MRKDLTISGAWTQIVLRGLEQCGLDVRALCMRSGLVYTQLNDAAARVPRDQSGLLWRAAAQASDDECLGLHAAERSPVSANNLVAHLLMSSRTLREGFRLALAHQRLLAHETVVTLKEHRDLIEIQLARVGGDLPVTPHEIDFMAVVLVRFATFVLPPGAWHLTGVRLERTAPASGPREHERVFGCSVGFTQPENALVVPATVMDATSPHYSPGLLHALEVEAAAQEQQLAERSLRAEVRVRLRQRLRSGVHGVEEVAPDLHLSVRTLQRRLGAEGTSFSAVLDETRRDAALELLAGDPSLKQISKAVGLSSTRALVRAMKRWTGLTPSEWRTVDRRS